MSKDRALIEGLLFMSGEEGLSLLQIQSAANHLEREKIQEILASLQEEYAQDKYGFSLEQYAGRWKLLSKEWIYPYAKKLFEELKSVPLSSAAMETLAIIAYRQPITRVEIEEIRGVGSDMILKKLQARNLIEAKSRLDTVGKPLLYTVTDEFLDAFQLASLKDLPQLPQTEDNSDLFERQG